MSVAYFIVLDQDDPGFDPFVNGKVLAREAENLESVTQDLGINSFEDWLAEPEDDYLEEAPDFGDDDDDSDFENDDDSDPPSGGTWFEPVEGINWLQTLIAHIEENEIELDQQEDILEELGEFLEVLEQAEASGARWRLQLDR